MSGTKPGYHQHHSFVWKPCVVQEEARLTLVHVVGGPLGRGLSRGSGYSLRTTVERVDSRRVVLRWKG